MTDNKQHDVHVIDRDTLDDEHAAHFSKPWLVQFADGDVWQFDTEEEACACQREWRGEIGLDPMTGEPTWRRQ